MPRDTASTVHSSRSRKLIRLCEQMAEIILSFPPLKSEPTGWTVEIENRGAFCKLLKSHGILGNSHQTRGHFAGKKRLLSMLPCILILYTSTMWGREQIMRKCECATLLVCHTLLPFYLSLSWNSFIFLLFCRFQRMGGETRGMNSRKRKSDMSLRYCSCVAPWWGPNWPPVSRRNMQCAVFFTPSMLCPSPIL